METLLDILSVELLWFIVGLIFILLEFIIPGVIIIFFGAGAWITALTLMLFSGLSLNTQLVIFLTSSIVLLVILRKKLQSIFVGKTSDGTVKDIDDITGKKVKVIKTIQPDQPGKVLYNGANWNAEADQKIPEGKMVKIVEKNNITLTVKPLTKE